MSMLVTAANLDFARSLLDEGKALPDDLEMAMGREMLRQSGIAAATQLHREGRPLPASYAENCSPADLARARQAAMAGTDPLTVEERQLEKEISGLWRRNAEIELAA